ncbi:MAG: hypothetical protein AAGE94_04880 [Acidobacteriota bacterium]
MGSERLAPAARPASPASTEGRYRLAPDVRTSPLDVATPSSTFLVETADDRRFQISAGVQALIEVLRGADPPLSRVEMVERLRAAGMISANIEKVDWLLAEVLVPRGIAVAVGAGDAPEPSPIDPKPTGFLRNPRPLLSERAVDRIARPFSGLFAAPVVVLLLAVGTIAHLHVYLRILPHVELSLAGLDWADVILLLVISHGVTMFHELGHASASRRFGVAPGPIGWARHRFTAVLYADVSRTWRLDRYRRAAVDAGGLYFEWIAATCLIFYLWIRPASPILYLLPLVHLGFLFSASPIRRRDGYWLLKDLTGRRDRLRPYPKDAPAVGSGDRPSWVRRLLTFYPIVSGLLLASFILWLGHRLVSELLPGLIRSGGALWSALGTEPFVFDVVLSLLAQTLFGLFFVAAVVLTAWSFVESLNVFMAAPASTPRHAPGTHVEWKKAD